MKDRIKKIRINAGLTQQQFADELKIKRGTVANYEVGRNEPINAVISLICKTFTVNETWLRTGVGEMLQPVDQNAAILVNYIGDIKNLITALSHLSKLSSSDWERLEQLTASLSENTTHYLKVR